MVQGRCTDEEKARWQRAADAAHVTLGEALREALDEWTDRALGDDAHHPIDGHSSAPIVHVMAHDPAFCTPDLSLREAAGMMRQCDCGELPVVNDEHARRVVGVITDRDMVLRCIAEGLDPMETTVGAVMSTPAFVAQLDSRVGECAKIMAAKRVRRVPIVDVDGRLCGMLSQADLAAQLSTNESGALLQKISLHREDGAIPRSEPSSAR